MDNLSIYTWILALFTNISHWLRIILVFLINCNMGGYRPFCTYVT